MRTLFFFLIGICLSGSMHAQIDAQSKLDTAKMYLKMGKTEASVKLLEELVKSDNQNFEYSVVLSDAYISLQKYKKAIALLEKYTDSKSFTEKSWSTLGNTYYLSGNIEKAREVLKKGLVSFPKSGMLFRDLGLLEMYEKKFQNAIKYWDMGIGAQPDFEDNYYCEARLFANSPNKIWAIFYGEIYLNISADSVKRAEMSKILFDVYSKNVIIKPDFYTVDLVAETNVNVPVTNEKIRLPFTLVYQKLMLKSVDPLFKNQQTFINLENICKIRNNVVDNIIETEMNNEYPNVVFSRYLELKKEKILDCYHYWLMGSASPDEFKIWKEKNEEHYSQFLDYINSSPLILDGENLFRRPQ